MLAKGVRGGDVPAASNLPTKPCRCVHHLKHMLEATWGGELVSGGRGLINVEFAELVEKRRWGVISYTAMVLPFPIVLVCAMFFCVFFVF